MSALTVQHEPVNGESWEGLVRLWEGTNAPEGCKVEIIKGIVTVAPPPVNHHNYIAELVQEVLYAAKPADCGIYQTLNIAVQSRIGLYIPDLAVVPRDVVQCKGNSVPADAAELVVEITSKWNASNDRVAKLAGYAAAGVPLYLLIDPYVSGSPTVHLYGDPQDGTYRLLSVAKFGDPVRLPGPFDLTLDTSLFPCP
ncbi:Uma2 family endonuclease [Streptomyces sp. NPDC002044]|uniref:Uma2 family endonuclease n=1 Tax=Streptomyces sp. NPDC002044 TaxID=3154662 RepID=UPI00332A944C